MHLLGHIGTILGLRNAPIWIILGLINTFIGPYWGILRLYWGLEVYLLGLYCTEGLKEVFYWVADHRNSIMAEF